MFGFDMMEVLDFLQVTYSVTRFFCSRFGSACEKFGRLKYPLVDIFFKFRSGIITTGKQLSKIVRQNSVIRKICAR